MLFNSLTFIGFLFSVGVAFFLLRQSWRPAFLLAASLCFYGFWKVEFIPLLLFSALVDYVVALNFKGASGKKRKLLLLTSLTTNIGLLIYFKYLYFLGDNISAVASIFGYSGFEVAWHIVLPLGISFYTFQTISYTVDCYRGVIEPEKNPIVYFTYVSFFPQLVAGPVLRAAEVIPQLHASRRPRVSQVVEGFQRVILGLFLKVVIADNIAPFVDAGFSLPAESLLPLDVWTLAFLFGFQIYFDFSAYSHIAIGSAKMLGFDFPENFNFPYIATSPRDFWRRWHISLSSWIRDYLYLPLTGERFNTNSQGGLEVALEQRKRSVALFGTWTIMGLWHGANWTFAVWGLYHAVVIYAARKINFRYPHWIRKGAQKFLGVCLTLPIMMLGWIPFRASSLGDVMIMWGKVFQFDQYTGLGMRENVYLVASALLFGFLVTSSFYSKRHLFDRLHSPYRFVAYTLFYTFVLSLVIVFLRPVQQFIYFQF